MNKEQIAELIHVVKCFIAEMPKEQPCIGGDFNSGWSGLEAMIEGKNIIRWEYGNRFKKILFEEGAER